MRVRAGLARRVVRVAVACAVGVAGVGLWAGPALAVECPSRATQCRDWSKVPGRGWMKGVVCPEYRSKTSTERVRNLTENELVLAAGYIDCYDWSNTGNPSQITGRVLDPGETFTYLLERRNSVENEKREFRMGVFLPSADGMQEMGFVRLNPPWAVHEDGVKVSATNTFLPITGRTCRVKYLGRDPKRTKSGASFLPEGSLPMTTVYSDGAKLWAARCGMEVQAQDSDSRE